MVLTDQRPDDDVDDPTDAVGFLAQPRVGMAVVVATVLLVAIVVAVRWSDDVPPPPGETDSSADGTQTGDRPEPLDYVIDAEVVVGTSASLTNDDDVVHTFTSDDGFFDTGPVQPGESANVPSLPPGTYGYHCSIHPALTGELVVRD